MENFYTITSAPQHGYHQNFDSLANSFVEKRYDLDQFRSSILPLVYTFTLRYLARNDHDLAGDYLVHIYEKIKHFLLRYLESERKVGFGPYFARCLRNSYYNFYRHRNSDPPLIHLEDIDNLAASENTMPYCMPVRTHPQDMSGVDPHNLKDQELRLMVKMRYGMPLRLEDIACLIRITGCAIESEKIINTYKHKIEKNRKVQHMIFYQSSGLNFRIGNVSDVEAVKLKKKISHVLKKRNTLQPVMSIFELSRIFRVGKSTVSRRMELAHRLMRSSILHHKTTGVSALQ